MTVALIISGLVASGVFSLFVASTSAPVGYEDDEGFHLGQAPRQTSQS